MNILFLSLLQLAFSGECPEGKTTEGCTREEADENGCCPVKEEAPEEEKSESTESVKISSELKIMGALDRALIDEVIKANLEKVTTCYQKELLNSPDLKGNIVVKFVIGADGSVSKTKIKSSSLKSEAVETCILEQFKTFIFPKPSGGGIVIVAYPFAFSS